MVMETPSPQCVGHEFVRQYYTVLNKAPMHLHRFYSNNSLFMHGGPNNVNDPTIGQADIHKKILSLNFQDCHAKIRMVDAHATLGSGVVIQVTGELSNNGMPMRRFMQTFVLAPQSAKKYYVHNDIFRYQDEVFNDEEICEEGSSDPEEELETQSSGVVESSYSTNSATINGTTHHHNHLPHHEPETTPPIPVTTPPAPAPHIPSPSQVTPAPVITPAPVPSVQVPVTPPAVPTVAPAPIPAEPRPSTPPVPEADGWGTPAPSTEEWSDTIEEPIITPTPKKDLPAKTAPPQPEPAQSVGSQSMSNEPKTFANLFKNTSSNFSHASPVSVQNSTPVHHEQNPIPQQSYASHQTPRPESTSNRSGGTSGQSPATNSQPQGTGVNLRLSRNFHDDDKRRPAVPDSQQVFVGNLPHSIGEDQLRGEFTQYGKILDIRINTGKGKTGAKGPGHQVPNFGFIAFDEETAVTRCLNARPIYLNENRINVEEKKARSRVDSAGGMSGGGGRPNSGRGGMGGSGGMRGGGQGLMQGGGRGGGRGSFNRDNARGGSGSRGGFIQRR